MRRVRLAALIMICVFLLPPPAAGHESDQYTIPLGREFADLRFYMSNQIYNRLDAAVERVNRKIGEALQKGNHAELREQIQTPDAIASAVYDEFPSILHQIRYWDNILNSDPVKSTFPGMQTAYEPESWMYYHWKLIIDPTKFIRQIRTSTFMINGTYLGTDKLAHFFDIGYVYYRKYRRSLKKGIDKDEAVDRSVHLSAGNNLWFSENRFLGTIITGVRSSADLAANYLGMKFYRNLTEEVRLKGEMRPPMLVLQDEYWRLNDHVRPEGDFFSVFISDHLNEALNPSYYSKGMRSIMLRKVRERCDDLLKWYRDERGDQMSRDQFMRINRELSSYYGEDYGHEKEFENIISIANVCFDDKGTSGNGTGLMSKGGTMQDASQRGAGIETDLSDTAEWGDVNSADRLGRTPLWWAARQGVLDEVKDLIIHGADYNAADIDGETPLHAAARWGHTLVAGLLLEKGADVNKSSDSGITPLHLAVREMDDDLVNVLLYHGANVNARDIFGCTPLHDGISRSSGELVDLLLSAGADPEAKDMNGTTPLHRAARAGNIEIVKKLLALGVDVKSLSFLGKTSLDEAVQGDHKHIAKYLSSQ